MSNPVVFRAVPVPGHAANTNAVRLNVGFCQTYRQRK